MEATKHVSARASRWLILGSALLVLAVYAIGVVTGSDDATFVSALGVGAIPLGVTLPVIAILGVAGEWSTGSVQFTYIVEPRRMRVLSAQVAGALLVCVVLWMTSVAAAAAVSLTTGEGDAGMFTPESGWTLLGMLVLLLVNTLSGAAFAAVLQNTPAAIVAFLALPTVGVVLLGLLLGDHPIVGWLSINNATSPLFESRALSGSEWARLSSAVLVWVALPMAAGAARLSRRDA